MIQQNTLSARFLVAKYVPDLRRMEPRNVGVIVWANGEICARFSGEDSPVPTGAGRGSAFSDWVEYWRVQILKAELRRKDGSTVSRDTSAFLDQLKTRSKSQFMLVDGGVLLDDPGEQSIHSITDQLFEELVAPLSSSHREQSVKEAGQQLFRASQKAMKVAGLISKFRGDVRERYDWICPVGSARQSFHFDFAIHTDGPRALINRVPWKPDRIYSTAFQFDHMLQQFKQITTERCASLVYATENDMKDKEIQESWKLLSSMSTVINVIDSDTAAAQLLTVAG